MFSQEPESDVDSAEEDEEFRSLGSFRSSDELETSMEDAAAPGLAHIPTCTEPGHYVAAGHPVSSHTRILYHPTFEGYYATVAALQKQETPQMQIHREQGIFINNGGYFYTDPLQPPGHRVYNFLSPQTYNMFGIFRLVTPPPIMSPGIFVPNLEVLQSSAVPGDPHSAVPEETSDPPELIPPGESKAFTPSPSVHPSRDAVHATGSMECTSDTWGSSEPVRLPGSGRSFFESTCSEESGRSLSKPVCVPIGLYRDSPYTLSELEAVSGLLHLSASCPPSGGQ